MKANFFKDIDSSTEYGMEELVGEFYDNRLYTAKDLGITSRTLSYWKEKKVLTWFEPHKTARFNLLEAAWLCVLKFLQRVGLSIELMRELTRHFIDEALEKDLAHSLIKEEIKRLKQRGEENSLTCMRLSETLKKKSSMDKLRNELNHFTQLTKYALISKAECGIIIDANRRAYGYTENTFSNPDNLAYLFSGFNIIIPLKPILIDLIVIDFTKGAYNFPVLSRDESIIIREMRRADTENIIVKKKGTETLIKVAKATEKSSEELARKIMDGEFDGWDNVTTSKRDKTKWFVVQEKKLKK